MSDNPYQAPKTESAIGVLSGSHADLLSVAQYQKGILVCILIYIIAVIAQFALPPEMRLFLGIGVVALGLVAAVFVFLLAIKVYGAASGILMGVLSLVPLLGLVILLLINGKATTVLKQNGFEVGLLGANLAEVKAAAAKKPG